MRNFIKLLAYPIVFTVLMLHNNQVSAQEVSLSVSPAIQEIVTQPGQSIELNFTIINHGDPQQMSFKMISFEPKVDGTIEPHDKNTGPLQFTIKEADTSFNQPVFLRGDDKKNFTLIMQVPPALQEKDYYISLVTQSQAPPTSEGAITARAQLAVASNILVSVTSDGSLDTKPRVISFNIPSKNNLNFFGRKIALIQAGEKVPMILTVSNSGRHLIKAQGTITPIGLGGKNNLTFEPQTILASSQSLLYASGSTSTSNYSAHIDGFLLGPYTLNAMINFGPATPVIYAKTNFIVIPSLPLLAGILIVFTIIAAYFVKKARS